ncbi:MAG: hypothetical protein A3G87_06985 [Omnitrophica bacterium RIFCSPLOWO2_12_FULL_50_11]|nr:MAG: hypothetical protein A3G87_06985 [Omnitrophica bacterium RIFCSPLOWO2_12_FULL_50_11]
MVVKFRPREKQERNRSATFASSFYYEAARQNTLAGEKADLSAMVSGGRTLKRRDPSRSSLQYNSAQDDGTERLCKRLAFDRSCRLTKVDRFTYSDDQRREARHILDAQVLVRSLAGK